MNDGLKQRLIGALVLVGVGVIFLPGFFREGSPYQVDTSSQIPVPPAADPVEIEPPRRIADVSPSPEPDTMFLPEAEQPVHEDPDALIAAAETAPDKPAAAPAATPADETEATAGEGDHDGLVPGAWVVQVASLRSEASARTLRDKLQDRGYKAYIRRADTDQGALSRVYIGPKFERETALAIKREIDPLFKVDALVLQFQP